MARLASLAALALVLSALPPAARAARAAGKPLPPEPGSWWEMKMEMTIRTPGTPPQGQRNLQTQRECLPKRIPDKAPPRSGDCTWLDYRRSGSRVTFKLRCADGVTGEADLVWTSDTYSGTTVMRGPGMENRIKVTGKKVGGDCDANEEDRREQAEAAAAEEAPRPDRDEGADEVQEEAPKRR